MGGNFNRSSFINAAAYDTRKVMAAVADAIVKCKFEASDTATDEIALMRLLQLIKTSMESTSGRYLTDDMIKLIFDTCFSICFQMRLSELLRRTSESTIFAIVKVLLKRTLEGVYEAEELRPVHGVAAIETFLNHTIKLLDPADYTNTDNTRLVCLKLVCATLETSEGALRTLGLVPCVLKDKFCRYLFTVSRNKAIQHLFYYKFMLLICLYYSF